MVSRPHSPPAGTRFAVSIEAESTGDRTAYERSRRVRLARCAYAVCYSTLDGSKRIVSVKRINHNYMRVPMMRRSLLGAANDSSAA